MEQPIINAIIGDYVPYSVKCDISNFYKTLQSTNNVIIKQHVDDIILIPLNDKGKQEIDEIKEKVKEIIKQKLK